MNPADISPDSIRHFLANHKIGKVRAARMLAPKATPEEQRKLANRIGAIATHQRRKEGKATPAPSPAPLPPPPTATAAPPPPDDDGLAAELRHDLWQLETDMMGMRDKGSWQALVSATRERRNIRERLVELDALAEEEAFDPTDIDQIVDEILELPEEVLRHPKLIEAIEAARVH